MNERPTNILDQPTPRETGDEIHALATGPGLKHLQRSLGRWLLFRYSGKGDEKTLDLLVNPEGHPTATLTRRPDGTAVLEPENAARITALSHIEWWPDTLATALKKQAWDTMLRYLADNRPHSPTPMADLRDYKMTSKGRDGTPSVSNMIRSAVKEALEHAEINGKALQDPKTINNALKTALTETMTDGTLTEVLRRYLTSESYLRVHNLAIQSREAVIALDKECPQILWAHLHFGDGRDQSGRQPFTTESATASARRAMALDGDAWELFLRIDASGSPHSRPYLETTRAAFVNTAEAGGLHAPPRTARTAVLNYRHYHEFFANAQWDHGVPRDAWVEVLTGVMDNARRNPAPWETTSIRAEGQDDLDARARKLERTVMANQPATK